MIAHLHRRKEAALLRGGCWSHRGFSQHFCIFVDLHLCAAGQALKVAPGALVSPPPTSRPTKKKGARLFCWAACHCCSATAERGSRGSGQASRSLPLAKAVVGEEGGFLKALPAAPPAQSGCRQLACPQQAGCCGGGSALSGDSAFCWWGNNSWLPRNGQLSCGLWWPPCLGFAELFWVF